MNIKLTTIYILLLYSCIQAPAPTFLDGIWYIHKDSFFEIKNGSFRHTEREKDGKLLTETLIFYKIEFEENKIILYNPKSTSKIYKVSDDGSIDRTSYIDGEKIIFDEEQVFYFKREKDNLELNQDEKVTKAKLKKKM